LCSRIVAINSFGSVDTGAATFCVKEEDSIKNYLRLLVSRARMEGFLYFDYANEFPQAIAEIAQRIQKGELKYRNHIVEGLENAPSSLLMLFDGRNEGKLIVHVSVAGLL